MTARQRARSSSARPPKLSLPPGEVRAEAGTGRLTVAAPDGTATLLAAAAALAADGITVDDLGLRQPSLDEAFLALTQVAP
jgi:ABC-2 type transport system ATP-binding protein